MFFLVNLGPTGKGSQAAGKDIALTTASFESAFDVDVEHLPVWCKTRCVRTTPFKMVGVGSVDTYFPLVMRSTFPFSTIVGPSNAFASLTAA